MSVIWERISLVRNSIRQKTLRIFVWKSNSPKNHKSDSFMYELPRWSLVKLDPSYTVATMTKLTVTEYMLPLMTTWYFSFVVITIWSFSHSWLFTGYVTKVTGQVLDFTPFCFTPISWVRVVYFFKLHVLRSVLWCTLRFPHFGSPLPQFILPRLYVLLML